MDGNEALEFLKVAKDPILQRFIAIDFSLPYESSIEVAYPPH